MVETVTFAHMVEMVTFIVFVLALALPGLVTEFDPAANTDLQTNVK
jgi:hypothetical protein